MAIEISELTINTTITNQAPELQESGLQSGGGQSIDIASLREAILTDCKLLINETLERERER